MSTFSPIGQPAGSTFSNSSANPEPTFTKAEVEQLVEAIAAKVERLSRMEPTIKKVDLITRTIGARYTDSDTGELLVRDEVLEAIKGTKL